MFLASGCSFKKTPLPELSGEIGQFGTAALLHEPFNGPCAGRRRVLHL
jgi:hypothetical protein